LSHGTETLVGGVKREGSQGREEFPGGPHVQGDIGFFLADGSAGEGDGGLDEAEGRG
jgi:hypothetical protein